MKLLALLTTLLTLCSFSQSQNPAVFQFISVDPAGVGFDDNTPVSSIPAANVGNNPGQTLGELRSNVLEAAAERWSTFLCSDVPIVVNVDFEDFNNTTTLAGASARTYSRNFNNAPLGNTFYPIALANSLAGVDLAPTLNDINITANSNDGINTLFYYGLDGNPPNGLIDFLSIIAHELGHGLGFASAVNSTTGAYFFGGPDIFSSMIRDTEVGLDWLNMTDAQRQASAVNDPNLTWNGGYVTAAIDGVQDYVSNGRNTAVETPPGNSQSFQANQAQFGGAIPQSGITGQVVLIDDGVAPVTDAVDPIVNVSEVSGNIALIDRGTNSFDVKVSRAQVAGAVAVVIANNVGGDELITPSASGTADPTPTIPMIFISQNSGNTLRNLLNSGNALTYTMFSGSLLVQDAGSAPAETVTRLRLFAPSVLQGGSSVSHWTTASTPNLLMEPAINRNLSPDLDLSPILMKDLGWSTRDIAIPHVTYQLWLAENGLTETSANANPEDDLDGDGVPNAAEYFHDTDPLSSEDGEPFSCLEGETTLSYERSTITNDLLFTYEDSVNLQNWSPVTLPEVITPLGAQNEAIEATTGNSGDRGFTRIRIDLQN